VAKNKEKPQEQTFEYQGKKYKTSFFNEYEIDDFNQYLDLNNKMDKMAFNLRQLNGGLTYYKSKVDKHIEKYNQENK
jgi:hypothetical protein